MSENNEAIKLPMVALRGLVVFPYTVLNFEVGRDVSIKAVEQAMEGDQRVFLVAQKDMRVETPTPKDLYDIGVVASIRHIIRIPGGVNRVMVEGLHRARLLSCESNDCYEATVENCEQDIEADENAQAHMRLLIEKFETMGNDGGPVPPETISALYEIKSPAKLVDTIAINVITDLEEKQELLETLDVIERCEKVLAFANTETQIANIEREITQKTQKSIDKSQKEYFLREQMKTIQSALGEGEDDNEEIDGFAEAIKKMPVDEATREKLMKDVKHLKRMNTQMPDYNVLLNYLEYVTNMPYGIYTHDNMDLAHAREVLDGDHYGMDKVKDRIIEYFAVRRLKQDMKGPIICLAGPPGVGKTSIARSVAKATERKFVRMSLGGVQDEAEIRGHRRTYVGAIPGRIISNIKKAGTMNPLFLLDEIDKMGKDYKGDPASAMLEVLDGEINKEFQDHYLDMDFDLSNVMFITTANDISQIPAPLYDRMEVIELPGYTAFEKEQIAKRHLIKKQMAENGLPDSSLEIDDSAIDLIITGYTMESGVRTLEREIGTICRKAAAAFVENGQQVKVTETNLADYLGAVKYVDTLLPKKDTKGVAVGLAWTAYGGTVLPVEAITMEGTGKLELTGNLGDIMKESAHIGRSLVMSMAKEIGFDEKRARQKDIHIHAPEGAVSKDGPSAGITMALAMASVLSNRKIRHDIAMTGEVTLTGRVLAIGGLKEKSLAAARFGMKKILIPRTNLKDIEDIPKEVASEIEFIPVDTMSDVIEHALKGSRQ